MKWLKRNWGDPVWSKVIATAICTIAGFIVLVIYAMFTKQSAVELTVQLLKLYIPVWVVLLLAIIVFVIFLIVKSWEINKKTAGLGANILVDIANIDTQDFEIERIRSWDSINNKAIGEPAQGNFTLNNGVLSITRDNNQGRFLLRIARYNINGERPRFIKNEIHRDSVRRLFVTFQAKVIGGEHTFRVICKKSYKDQWVHNASISFKITSDIYQDFAGTIKVPVNEDFFIQMDDIDVQNPNSSIQIKGLKITDVL